MFARASSTAADARLRSLTSEGLLCNRLAQSNEAFRRMLVVLGRVRHRAPQPVRVMRNRDPSAANTVFDQRPHRHWSTQVAARDRQDCLGDRLLRSGRLTPQAALCRDVAHGLTAADDTSRMQSGRAGKAAARSIKDQTITRSRDVPSTVAPRFLCVEPAYVRTYVPVRLLCVHTMLCPAVRSAVLGVVGFEAPSASKMSSTAASASTSMTAWPNRQIPDSGVP